MGQLFRVGLVGHFGDPQPGAVGKVPDTAPTHGGGLGQVVFAGQVHVGEAERGIGRQQHMGGGITVTVLDDGIERGDAAAPRGIDALFDETRPAGQRG